MVLACVSLCIAQMICETLPRLLQFQTIAKDLHTRLFDSFWTCSSLLKVTLACVIAENNTCMRHQVVLSIHKSCTERDHGNSV